ncbi:hypothetical protein DFJ43DRAFT_1156970 [Lentinula guzmanii]|uniref:Uncharacterized protein n=1 Tax=Lentinula guzmanii TaxID=2804957 RepID=A0AA38JG26_9AGAR|nr:hypothetical protein DFJ43DRAFT_1156970 [Lentinula guzmanii]
MSGGKKRSSNFLSSDEEHIQSRPRRSSRSQIANFKNITGTQAEGLIMKKAKELKKKISHQTAHTSANNDDSNGEPALDSENDNQEFESEEDFRAQLDDSDTTHFIPASTVITPMQTMVTPAVPRVDLTRIHRKQTFTLSTPKTPRRAFISIQHDSSPVPDENSVTVQVGAGKPPLLSFATDYKPGGKAKADDYDSEGKAIILRADAIMRERSSGSKDFPRAG